MFRHIKMIKLCILKDSYEQILKDYTKSLLDALAELSPEERELYIRLNEKYNCRLIEKLYRIMDEVNQDRKDCD